MNQIKKAPVALQSAGSQVKLSNNNYTKNSQEKYTNFLKDEIPIQDVVDKLGGLNLTLVGNSLQGNCPTGHSSNNEKCFSIKIEENFFNCFSCGKGGNIIHLVQLIKNCESSEAKQWLIKNFKSELASSDYQYESTANSFPEEYYQNAALYELIVELGKPLLYEKEGEAALAYLKGRGYAEENLRQTEWIYFPPNNEIRSHLLSLNLELNEQIQNLSLNGFAGDNFRLAFPYRDRQGVITGFIKRATQPDGITVNGKQGVRYDSTKGLKKHDLFKLHSCKGHKRVLIVEGYPDAMYLPTLGLANITAVGQGLLSINHPEGLEVFGIESVVICFDNDPPKEDGIITGVENTKKAIEKLQQKGIKAYVIDPLKLAPYKDPDEFVKANGIQAFKALMASAEDAVKWKTKQIIDNHDIETDIGRDEALSESLDYESHMSNPIDRKNCLRVIAEVLGMSDEFLEEEVKGHRDQRLREVERSRIFEEMKRGINAKNANGSISDLEEFFQQQFSALKLLDHNEEIESYSWEIFLKDLSEAKPGLRTGYKELDEIVRIQPEAITIIAGRPSHGKTTVQLNLLVNMIKEYPDQSFIFCSYEETAQQVLLKILTILSGEAIEISQKFKAIEMYIKDQFTNNPKLNEEIEFLKKLLDEKRLILIAEPLEIDKLTRYLSSLNDNHDIGAVFIDYIQKIKIKGKFGTRQLELQKVSEKILEAAKELSFPIILGAQLGRDKSSGKGKGKVRLDNLREAGDIEQDANLVIGIYNELMEESDDNSEDEINENLILTILKNRNGQANKSIELEFDRPALKIKDYSGNDEHTFL